MCTYTFRFTAISYIYIYNMNEYFLISLVFTDSKLNILGLLTVGFLT